MKLWADKGKMPEDNCWLAAEAVQRQPPWPPLPVALSLHCACQVSARCRLPGWAPITVP
jgi:hypothetical protein